METPCRRLCTLDDADQCTGCGRSLDEIVRWTAMTDAERAQIMARVADYDPDSRSSNARLRSSPQA